jgi:Ataxin-3
VKNKNSNLRSKMNIRSFSDMNRENSGGEGSEGDNPGGYDPTDQSPDAPRSFSEYAYRKRTNPPKKAYDFGQEKFVYHEVQESALCGQHALNNLVQGRAFTEMDLAEIAQGLDMQERSLGLSATMGPGTSSNVDSTGNFSIQVLRVALQKSHGMELASWTDELKDLNPLREDGFVVNRREHWFALRNIGGRWWNLNSTMERPEWITDQALVGFMRQLRSDGFHVFIPTSGKMPKAGVLPSAYDENYDGKYWLTESELLRPPVAANAAPKVAAFSGKGQRLDGKVEPEPVIDGMGMAMDEDDDPELAAAIAASLGGAAAPISVSSASTASSFDADMAAAIAASVQEAENVAYAGKSDKEIAREKRLAAMQARGL